MRAGKPWLISRAKQPRNSTRSPADKRALPRCHHRVCSSDLISVKSELWGHDSLGVGRAQHSTPWFSSQPTPKPRRAHDHGTSKTCGITESFNSCYSSKLHSVENCVSAIIQVVKGGSCHVGAGDVLSCSFQGVSWWSAFNPTCFWLSGKSTASFMRESSKLQ